MNKFLIVIIAIPFLLLGCNNFITFSVMPDEEAVITQGEKIIRDTLGPGLHYKIPFFQTAHIIKKHRIRKCEFNSSSHKNTRAIVMWNVFDSTKFFLFSRNKTEQEIENILKSKTKEAMNPISGSIINKIALAQERNPQYTDKNSLIITDQLQNSIKKLGINIHLIVYQNEVEP